MIKQFNRSFFQISSPLVFFKKEQRLPKLKSQLNSTTFMLNKRTLSVRPICLLPKKEIQSIVSRQSTTAGKPKFYPIERSLDQPRANKKPFDKWYNGPKSFEQLNSSPLEQKQPHHLVNDQVPKTRVRELPYRQIKTSKALQFTKQSHRARTNRNLVVSKPLPEEFGLIHVKKTKNNTHCSISNLFGNQKTTWSISGGQISGGKSNGRRKTRYTQRMIFKAAAEKLLGLGFKYLAIHCRGPTVSKRYIFKNFFRRFKIILLKDFAVAAHNGCRPRSVRRL